MKKILALILLFCSVLLNAATNVVSWNPPAGGVKKTYSDSYSFSTHDYIDLGLPSGTLWATTNIGASFPEEQGNNYAWGELCQSENFWTSDSKNYTVTKYNTSDNLIELEPEDDVATIMWGSNWKMPTKEDFQELIDNCVVTYDYTSAATAAQLDSKDYVTLKFTAQNGNYILLPQSKILASKEGIDIYYWTSSSDGTNLAYSYYYQTTTKCNRIQEFERWRSMPIRPICKFVEVQELSILPTLDLNVGETNQLEANITPYNATDPTIVWSSNNDSIAIVGQDGKVTAIKSGIAEIRAMTTDGSDLSAICRVSVHNPVTSVNLNINSAIMHVTESLTLQTICTPIDADDSSITWTSSNNSIVTVDNGIITAIGVGNAVVTASSVNGLYATCNVSVETTYAKSLTINKTSLSLVSGEQESLTATILPSYTTNKEISWKSSVEDIVTVSNSGVVRAISTGNARITATTSDGTCISAICDVSVTTPVKTVQLDKSSEILKVGESIILQASCFPSNADNTTITWASSDNTVATVVNGVVTAITLGEASITASSVNGIEAKCSITVVPTPVSSLEMNESTISIVKNQTFTLSCTIYPDNATSKELIWSSENESIAKVSENGVITGISAGETTILVKAKSNSKISASCSVVVTVPITSIKLDQDKIELFVEDENQLRAICSPEDADNNNVTWISSDTNIAEVSNSGYVKTKNEGSVRITVTTTDGTNLSATCDITVKKIQQSITWNDELLLLQEGGQMLMLGATSSSGLPVKFISNDDNVVSIFDLGDVVYANPVKSGTAIITSYQEGNYKYEPIESKKVIEVIEAPRSATKTLIAYYSQSVLIDGIVSELANKIASSNVSVYTQKIESTNDRINNANTDIEVRDSVMNVISLYPNEASSYPEIKTIHVNINDYDNIIMVYPLWNASMAAPVQTFIFNNKDMLSKKSIAYIEYDLFGEVAPSSNAKALRLSAVNIDYKEELIRDWLDAAEATGIISIKQDQNRLQNGIFDLQGRMLQKAPQKGMYIKNGTKVYAK